MKSISLFLAFLIAVSAFAGDGLDSLLAVQRIRTGARAAQIFDMLDKSGNGITADERADLRFLIAYMPLSDLASMTGDALLDNVRLARQARQDLAWGKLVDDELYRSFVLPYRVSQEPYVQGWRDQFLYELQPRLKNMSMTQAALEVNHWCHEKVTYKPSDSRDQDPLTTIRAGLGRCEEEMIFAICALRSVGIPARQCYTPYWAHKDDNHAWVELWADGQWHYFGACEPEPVLDKGWFSNEAARTMLVVSTAYGDYHGSEPVLRRYGRSTLINSTSVYGKTRELTVSLLNANGKPLPKSKLIFNLFNYGCLMPAMALETEADGTAKIVCGPGDWLISAGDGKNSALAQVKGIETTAVLRLDKTENLARFTEAFYAPPPEAPPKNLVEQDSLFRCRLSTEDSTRDGFWHVWVDELGNVTGRSNAIMSFQLKPDSVWVTQFAAAHKLDSAKLLGILRNARGNWGNLFRFLTGEYPLSNFMLHAKLTQTDLDQRLVLLDNLTEKDTRDFSLGTLSDHYARTTVEEPLAWPETWESVSSLDSVDRQRYEQWVLTPRINEEPSLPWRGSLYNFFKIHLDLLMSSKNDAHMIGWLRKNLAVDSEKDRLGSPLTPAQTLDIMRGSEGDIERLYVGLCRVRGIPARFNPVTDRLERWDNSAWTVVDLKLKAKGKSVPVKTGQLTVGASSDSLTQNALYFQDWGVSVWATDHLSAVDFGYHEPFSKLKWPQGLPEGEYCLSSGFRSKDGSAAVAFHWFDIKAGMPTSVKLKFSRAGREEGMLWRVN